ncbi:chemotaxis protein CheW [Acidipila rosea]|uniref:histidine kinase n=1 Tax=Acidipila rosea TaxID=768535 RepID=A0A4R1L1J0_9BACT|nr:chemotaxis protein CheW [Acidipila rosea]TCK70790.1 two-component system chemotaxis sensor kinase CheA [Acidipila rosea]
MQASRVILLKFLIIFPDNLSVDDLTREFLIESQEGLDRMERCLTELEDRPDDRELIADIFRSVHTIKGTTGFLGFVRLEKLAHAGENLLGLLRDGRLRATQEIISGLLALLDGLRSILDSIESDGNEGGGGDDAMIERLVVLQQTEPSNTSVQASPPQKRKKSTRKSRAKQPPAQAAETTAALAVLQSLETTIDLPANGAQDSASGGTAARSATADSTLRVDIDLLNRMMNLVGELVLTRNQILQATATDAGFALLSRRLDMVTADLRESVMKARMQPVSHVFAKFPRMVRDLSQMLNKRVVLEMEGQETELDKGLLEAIKDPLTHSVRNAIDHGIEMPEVREQSGKSPEGTLRLRAYQEGSHVLIEVSDDGGGMPVERIRDKAIERKLISREKAAQLSERELMQLIFLPGFSTAEAITNVSGRGVGMDVVRTNVEKIGGKVEIESRPGKGTTLRLRIPLTLAIIPALIVRCKSNSSSGCLQQSFALPQGALHELVHLSADEASTAIEWIENAALYRLRGKLLPLVFLDSLLGHGEGTPAHAGRSGETYIAVLNADGRHYGLVVDGLADPEEIVVKPLSSVLKQIALFSGATVLGNGEMALILDPGAIAARAGIRLAEETEDVEERRELTTGTSDEYLLIEVGVEQAALPLSDVLRIERLPRSKMERLRGRPVLRFEGTLLPVEDSAGLANGDVDGEMTVVVCRDGERHVGIAVTQVLDVAAGSTLAEAGTEAFAAGVTLLKERVTGVVNLARVPALPPMELLPSQFPEQEFAEAWQ